MKQLLNMAREKRQDDSQDIKKPSKLMLQKQKIQQFSQPSYEEQQQQYEPDDEQILAYAEYLGIRLPEEEQLLFIAREGLMADLPDQWANQQTETGQIIYINLRSGEKTMEHPCDQYYRQLVIKQRRKKGQQPNNKFVPIGSVNSQAVPIGNMHGINFNMAEPKKQIDPLVKMEMEKKKKRLEQQKHKQYEDNKQSIRIKFQKKKENLQKQLRTKQQKQKEKYNMQIEEERSKMKRKLSQKQNDEEESRRKQLEKYERDLKMKLDKKYHDKRVEECAKIDKQVKIKKEEIRLKMENQVKKSKKNIEEEYRQKLRIMNEKQKKSVNVKSSKQRLDEELLILKNQIIDKRIKEGSQTMLSKEIHQQDQQYQRTLRELEENYSLKMQQLENESNNKKSENKNHTMKIQNLMKQIENNEHNQIKSFQYQLQLIRETKQLENSKKLEQLKTIYQKKKHEQFQQIQTEYLQAIEKYTRVRHEQYQMKISEADKNVSQVLLNHMRRVNQKSKKQQEIAIMENNHNISTNTPNSDALELNLIDTLEGQLKKLDGKQNSLKRQLQSIRQQILRIRDKIKPTKHRLTQDQLDLYRVLKQKLLSAS